MGILLSIQSCSTLFRHQQTPESAISNESYYLRKNLRLRLLFILFITLPLSLAAQINVNHFIFNGKQAIVNNEFSEAIQLFNQVINVRPELHEPFFLRAIAKYNLGDYKGAEQDLSAAIEIKPNYPEALLYRGICRERLMNFNDAISDFDRALKLEPYNAEVYVSKAFTKSMMQEHATAIDVCDQAIKIDKRNERAYLCRAWNKFRVFDMEGALADYDKALTINKFNDDSYTKRGMVKAFKLNYAGAIEDFNEALKIDSTNIHTWYQLGHLYREMEDKQKALACFEKMVEIDSQSALGYFERGQLRSELNDSDGAIDDYTMVIVLTKGHLLTYFNRGSIYFEKGKYSAAIEDFSQTIAIYPDFAEAYFNRALAYSRLGMQGKATIDLEKATAIKAELYQLDESGQQKELKKIQELATIKDDFQGNDTRYGRIQNREVQVKPMADYFALPAQWIPDSLSNQAVIFTQLKSPAGNKLSALSHPGFAPENAAQRLDELNNELAKNPDNPEVLFMQGLLFQLLENYELAQEAYMAALQYDATQPAILLNLSVVKSKMLILLGGFESASGPSNNALIFNADFEQHQTAIKENLELILTDNPSFVPALFNLSNLLAAGGHYNESIQTLDEAIKLRPDLIPLHYNKALTLLYLGQTEPACYHLSIAGEKGYQPAYSAIKKYCQ
jgi:tetratricopeptide (TPR) repeat protein